MKQFSPLPKATEKCQRHWPVSTESCLQLFIGLLWFFAILFYLTFSARLVCVTVYVKKGRSRIFSRIRIRLGHQFPELSGSCTVSSNGSRETPENNIVEVQEIDILWRLRPVKTSDLKKIVCHSRNSASLGGHLLFL